MSKVYKTFYKSDIGYLEITASDKGVRSLYFSDTEPEIIAGCNVHIEKCLEQVDDYFRGKRKKFILQLDWQGTGFQKKVWEYLLTIPFGKTVSYMDIAVGLGDPKTIRAVGTANGRNPIPIIVPCHRVIGSDGKLTGYAGGLWRKEWLLNHEKEFSGVEKQMELF
ncbi:MAG: methylated-DNA--[protein]-cysteine S-methyltransferase [Ignavibacteria bacterium]|jgi:methylated-DNA-[protein]-cysteine S-methyltransferase